MNAPLDAEQRASLEAALKSVTLDDKYTLERGRAYNSSKRREKSGPLFESAWDLARAAGAEGYAVDAAHMLGIVEPDDSSIAWNRKAIAYAEQ